MSRRFADSAGRIWHVWATRPADTGPCITSALYFETDDELRTIVPPPDGWTSFTDQELATVCRRAVPEPGWRRF